MSNQASKSIATLAISDEAIKTEDWRSRPLNALAQPAASDEKSDESDSDDSAPSPNSVEEEGKGDDVQEGSNEHSDDNEDGESPKRSKGLEKKFKKLTAERTELRQQNDQLMQRLERLEQLLTKGGEKEEKSEPKKEDGFTFDKAKPSVDDFETMADYHEALADWKYDQRRAKEQYEARVSEQKQSGEKIYKDFIEKGNKLDKALGLEPGEWEDTVRDNTFKLSGPAYVAATEIDAGPRILYEIVTNPELREKFEALNERQQVAFIGKLDAKFESDSTTSPKGGSGQKKVTSAKPQGSSIKGSSNAVRFDRSKPVNQLANEFNISNQAEYKRLRKAGKI